MEILIDFTRSVIEAYGFLGIFILTTAEQFIFPIPVDFFVAMGTAIGLPFMKVLYVVLIATIIGAFIGYFLGKYLGHPVAAWLFGKGRLDKGEKFIKKWGIWGVMLAGLTPVPFKIITWTAGIFEMSKTRFLVGVLIGRIPRYLLTAYAGTKMFETKFYASTDMSAIILGGFQGVTEFLPISSSGHLVILEHFLNVPIDASQLATFDIILHGGSLLAILLYFWKDWWHVLKEIGRAIKTLSWKVSTLTSKLAIGTIPAIIAGLAFGKYVQGPLRNIDSVAFFFILLALLYFYAAWKGDKNKHLNENVTLKKSVLIGCSQALALIPGVSRAGATIATGVLAGINRKEAAHFSFLLGGIAILAANVYNLFSIRHGAAIPDMRFIAIGFSFSFVTSFAAIAFLLKYLEKHTLRAFGIYLLLMGIMILSFM